MAEERAKQCGVVLVDSLRELLSQADIVSLHLPLTEDTHHLINKDSLGWMKSDSLLVNASRGGLIDTVALANALESGQIGSAALDVFEQEPLPGDHPLRYCKNVMLTPHAAYYSDTSLITLQRQAAEEVVRWAKGEPLASPVNRLVTT